MAFSQGKHSSEFISIENILSKISEFDLLAYHLNINEIPIVINSPLRKDKSASFSLHTLDGIKIFYKDFGTGETGDTFDLLSKLWGLNHAETLAKIHNSISKIISNNETIKIHKKRKISIGSKHVELHCKIRNWRKYDIEFWEQYGISLPWLKFGDVYPISHIINIDNGEQYHFTADKYAYAYVERKDNKVTLKIYQPYNNKYKWRNNHDYSVWDLWNKLPTSGEKLIITSSRKDALCLWENTKIPSISLQAESCLPKKHVIEELKKRFTYIYILYDNDFKYEELGNINTGRLLGANIAETFNIIQLEIPREYNSKDPSDLCKNYDRKTVQTLIKQLITDAEKH